MAPAHPAQEQTGTTMRSRDSIKDIWGTRTPYKGEWPERVDERCTEQPEKWVQSACVLCSNGCGMDIGVKDGKIVGVRGRKVDRVNKGRLGPKGMHGWASNAHEDRLKYPMIRRNGVLVQSTWDQAMDLIVKKTKEIQSRLTNHGIGFYTSGQLFLEEYYTLAVIGKAGLNTLHMDGNTRLCTATAAASMRESFGCDGQPGSYTDIDVTDCIFMVGHNMSATQTVLWSRVLDRMAGPDPPKLIVVDPRQTGSSKEATVHLAPRIGTNLALLNGIQHLLFKNNWVDEEYIKDHVYGCDVLREKVAKYTPGYVSQICGIPTDTIMEAAEILGKAKSLLSTVLQGVYQSHQATASACQVNNINLLRGLIGKPGSGIFQMNGQPTAQNNRESGCDGEFPGFRNYQNKQQMQEIADVWNIDSIKVPHWNQPTHIQNMLNYIESNTIQMFWISGTNPLVSLPNLPRVRELLTKESLFVIAQDIFPTETTAIADVVLPAAQWGEKTGCFTNVDRTVHLSHKAIDPPGEARSDLEIFCDFAKRMDFRDKDGKPLVHWSTASGAFEEWKKMSSGRPCDYTGMTYELLTGGSGIQWPCNKEAPSGTERLFTDGNFYTDLEYCESYGHDLETGVPITEEQYRAMNIGLRAILKAADYIPDPEATDDEYPLQLSTGRKVYHFHTRTKTGRSKELQAAAPDATISISQGDADTAGIQDGEMVIVRSRRGAVEMKAAVADIAPGQVFIPFHYGYFDSKDNRARAANELTTESWDPISKQPKFKSGAVRIEKIPAPTDGVVKIHVHEQQSAAVRRVEDHRRMDKPHVETEPRRRFVELWLGATFEGLEVLLRVYERLISRLAHDSEIANGLRTIRRIGEDCVGALAPFMDRYEGSRDYGRSVSQDLSDTLFPVEEQAEKYSWSKSYETLIMIQSLNIYLSHIAGHVVALVPASQALWDARFRDAVLFVQGEIERQRGWVMQQINVRAPQTLMVPALVPKN